MIIDNSKEEKTQKQIDELLQKLQTWEDIDPHFMNDDLKELRHKVMHIHLRLEISLEILINDFLAEPFNKHPIKFSEKLILSNKLKFIFGNMDFLKKLKALQDAEKINKSTFKLLVKVNDVRKYFSHPLTYQDKLEEYKQPEKYLEILRLLVNAYTNFDQMFAIRRAFKELKIDLG